MGRPLTLALLLASWPSQASAAEQVLYVRHAGVVLRAGPSLGARTVGSVPARARAVLLGARSEVEEIEGETGRWAQVKVGDQEGWIFDRNLSFVRPLTPAEARRALLEGPVRCGRARLRLLPDGTGAAAAEPRSGAPPPALLNVRWWGEGPYHVVFEAWRRSRDGALAQEGLTLCELEYVDARELFEGREVDLRRRAPDTMAPLWIDGECRAGADEGCPALVAAVARGGPAEALAALLDGGADPNAATRQDWTALHHAARSGAAAPARLLLSRGARPGPKGRDGSSPLHLAAGAGSDAVVAALLERKADPGDVDRDGRTALHWAAGHGRAGAVEALLRHGAEADRRDFHGWTALSYAARRGHLQAMRALLAHGASPNARDRDDATALHAAAAECRAEAVGLLLGAGADPALRDRYGLQPVHHAYFARCPKAPPGLAAPPARPPR